MTREKPQVPEPTADYAGHRHSHMKQQVETNFNPGLAGEIADEWKSIGATFTQLAVDFQVIITGSESGWTGSAGEGARAALAKVCRFSDLTGDHFTSTGSALHSQVSAASEAKARMPEPVEYDPAKMFADATGRGNVLEKVVNLAALPVTMPMQKAASEAAKAEAVQVMRSRDDAMRSATTTMPAFAEIPTVTQDQGTATGTSRTSSVTTSTVDPDARSSTADTPGAGRTDTSRTTSTSWAAPPTVTQPPGTPPVISPSSARSAPPVQPPWMAPGPKPPTGTQPHGRPVSPPGVRPGGRPGTPGRLPGQGGGPGGTGGARPGMPGGMPSGPGGVPGRGGAVGFGPLGAGGQSGFGPTGTPGQAGSAVQGGRGSVGAAGGAGIGAGGQGGRGEEEQEHKARYLIPTDDPFHDDDRLVAPPTIGE
ncbi:hypothetical protein ACQPYE_09775 [Actinosynnema sp. CA-299493]